MAQTSVAQLATDLKMPVSVLLEQLQKAGLTKSETEDLLSEQDKSKLLEYLRRSHGVAETKTKITLTRKETSEIKSQDSHGKSRTVQVEVRKKRILVKRDAAETSLPSATPAELVEASAAQPTPALASMQNATHNTAADISTAATSISEPFAQASNLPKEADKAQEEAQSEEQSTAQTIAPITVVAPTASAAPKESNATETTAAQPATAAIKPAAKKKTPEQADIADSTKPSSSEDSSHASAIAENEVEAKKSVPVKTKKIVTRASIIGEEQQRLRAEEERRHNELRQLQETEFKAKQERSADLIRLKREAEEKAVAAKAAELAKQVSAQTATEKPEEEKTLHKPTAKPGAPNKKAGESKTPWKNEGANKHQGLKTRGATGNTSAWRETKHGKRHDRNQNVEEEHAFQAPTDPIVHEVHIPETISVSDL
ncbi:MAG: translation initiation factor IF-2 associated domain-containing protein, partial [Pseudomonadota bacterium]